MDTKRYNEVKTVLLRTVVDYEQHPDIRPWPTAQEFKEAGKRLYKEEKGKVIRSGGAGKHKWVGASRTHNGTKQYDAYICEDGDLIAY